ncbi:hypothetical protein [Rhodobaculum claviforme]|uniref:Uncharacterized protein n=1 Tax=Rhodobaculum claviforme TaxID=1549854 RepID=A0A934TIL4_9RHOB|nr:hypothetical protein [Rhodobaculum claviforme]MBK5925872.1 hypothetical protein [Rhodobaculum claviforme]
MGLWLALLLGLAVAMPAAALEPGPPLSAEEFEARVTGHTLHFMAGGEPYGTEQYLPGRRVIWAFAGEECREGSWFPSGTQICFVYDEDPGRQHCWHFYDSAEGMLARSAGPSSGGLIAVRRSAEPMSCPGPRIGV